MRKNTFLSKITIRKKKQFKINKTTIYRVIRVCSIFFCRHTKLLQGFETLRKFLDFLFTSF